MELAFATLFAVSLLLTFILDANKVPLDVAIMIVAALIISSIGLGFYIHSLFYIVGGVFLGSIIRGAYQAYRDAKRSVKND